MRLHVRPEAQAEFLEAQVWYELRSPGLGFDFARAIDAAVAGIVRNPLAFPIIHVGYRRAILRRFPYSLIYAVGDDEVLVVACFHHRRRPLAWRERLAP